MNYPKVSIITPTFNLIKDGRKHLFIKCVNSVRSQTYKNIEHIVTDGDSNDGTIELLDEFANKKWLKYYSKKDSGVDEAYNNGIAHSTGKYVAFMNSDDSYYDENAIENCVNALESNQADYCYGKEKQVTRTGRVARIFEPCMENFFKDVPYPHQTLVVRRDVLEKIGGYNTDCKYGGDVYLMLQLILNDYKGVYVDHFISLYTLGGRSGQSDDKKTLYQVYYVLGKRFLYLYKQFYPEISLEEAQQIYFWGNSIKAYPPMFLEKLRTFMIEKDLKYFDYNKFIDFITSIINQKNHYLLTEKCCEIKVTCYERKIYLFSRIPLLKIVQKKNKKYVKLFNFIPLFKIKEKL